MKKSLKKIIKITSFGIFFLALFLNLKISLENPYVQFSNAALAQTWSSSSSSSSSCSSTYQILCYNTVSTRFGRNDPYCGSCTYKSNSIGQLGTESQCDFCL